MRKLWRLLIVSGLLVVAGPAGTSTAAVDGQYTCDDYLQFERALADVIQMYSTQPPEIQVLWDNIVREAFPDDDEIRTFPDIILLAKRCNTPATGTRSPDRTIQMKPGERLSSSVAASVAYYTCYEPCAIDRVWADATGSAASWASSGSISFGALGPGLAKNESYDIRVPPDQPSGEYQLVWSYGCQSSGAPCPDFGTQVITIIVAAPRTERDGRSAEAPRPIIGPRVVSAAVLEEIAKEPQANLRDLERSLGLEPGSRTEVATWIAPPPSGLEGSEPEVELFGPDGFSFTYTPTGAARTLRWAAQIPIDERMREQLVGAQLHQNNEQQDPINEKVGRPVSDHIAEVPSDNTGFVGEIDQPYNPDRLPPELKDLPPDRLKQFLIVVQVVKDEASGKWKHFSLKIDKLLKNAQNSIT